MYVCITLLTTRSQISVQQTAQHFRDKINGLRSIWGAGDVCRSFKGHSRTEYCMVFGILHLSIRRREKNSFPMLSINIEAEVGVICAIPRLNLTIAIHCNPLGCMDEISLTQILITIKKKPTTKTSACVPHTGQLFTFGYPFLTLNFQF